MRKQDKKNRHYYRSSDRLYEARGAWYYETREADRGPFESREAAYDDLAQFLKQASAAAVATDGQPDTPKS